MKELLRWLPVVCPLLFVFYQSWLVRKFTYSACGDRHLGVSIFISSVTLLLVGVVGDMDSGAGGLNWKIWLVIATVLAAPGFGDSVREREDGGLVSERTRLNYVRAGLFIYGYSAVLVGWR